MTPREDRLLEEIRVNGMSDESEDQLRALLDERDELKGAISRLSEQRYRYRDLLESAEDVLRDAELDGMADRISAELEAKA